VERATVLVGCGGVLVPTGYTEPTIEAVRISADPSTRRGLPKILAGNTSEKQPNGLRYSPALRARRAACNPPAPVSRTAVVQDSSEMTTAADRPGDGHDVL
jgi:hypothetical protein